MKTTAHPAYSLTKSLTRVALVTLALLLIPVFGNLLVDGWNWGPIDFLFAAIMIFATGTAYVLISRKLPNPVHRIVLAGGLLFLFAAIWVEMAVDFWGRLFGGQL